MSRPKASTLNHIAELSAAAPTVPLKLERVAASLLEFAGDATHHTIIA